MDDGQLQRHEPVGAGSSTGKHLLAIGGREVDQGYDVLGKYMFVNCDKHLRACHTETVTWYLPDTRWTLSWEPQGNTSQVSEAWIIATYSEVNK